MPDAGPGAVQGGGPAAAGPEGEAGRVLLSGRVAGRRRQANVAGGRRAMYQVLVTEAERERLVALADVKERLAAEPSTLPAMSMSRTLNSWAPSAREL